MTITNEDNMQLMARYPDKYFDLAIVDPPYGIGFDGEVESMVLAEGKRGKNRKLNFFNIFSASFDFKDGICDFLSQNKIEYKVYERNNGYSINITKKESSSIFYTLIYSDANIYLSRKHEKYN